MTKKPKTKSDPLPAVSFRLGRPTLDQLDRIAEHYGLSNRTEAIRFLAKKETKKNPEKSGQGY